MRIVHLLPILATAISCSTMFKSQKRHALHATAQHNALHTQRLGGLWLSVDQDPVNELLLLNKWQNATKQIKQRLQVNPGDEKLTVALANALFMKKKYRAARFYARNTLKANPKNISALNIIALYHLVTARNNRDYNQAEKIFQQVFRSSTDEIACGLNLGFLYLRTKNNYFAHETFREVIKRCDDCQAAYLGLGISNYRRKRYKEAISILEDGLDIRDNDELRFHIALIYHYGKSVQSLKKARNYFVSIARNSKNSTLRNQARSQVAIIDEKDLYRYQNQHVPKKKKTTDLYTPDDLDSDFGFPTD